MAERKELERREEVLEQYRLASRRARAIAGKALAEIQDQDLYTAAGYSDFIEYCRERWQLGRSAAYALADLGRLALALAAPEDQKKSGTPENSLPSERQLRVLKRVRTTDERESPWRRRAVAWQVVTSKHGTDLEPPELEAELVTELMIAPRSKGRELSPAQKRERDLRRRRGVFERRFEAIVNAMAPEDFGEALGPVSEVTWFRELADWLARAEEASQ